MITPGLRATFSDPVASEAVATRIPSSRFDAGTASLSELIFENGNPRPEPA